MLTELYIIKCARPVGTEVEISVSCVTGRIYFMPFTDDKRRMDTSAFLRKRDDGKFIFTSPGEYILLRPLFSCSVSHSINSEVYLSSRIYLFYSILFSSEPNSLCFGACKGVMFFKSV